MFTVRALAAFAVTAEVVFEVVFGASVALIATSADDSNGDGARPAIRNSKATNRFKSNGLPTCSFMPAAKQASRSEAMALAVMATMGNSFSPKSSRIFRVAVKPSITGICKSIKTTSNGVCVDCTAATASTASCPCSAICTLAPSSSSNSRATCWLLALSSTTSKRKPCRRGRRGGACWLDG